jgi:hypothetical protein
MPFYQHREMIRAEQWTEKTPVAGVLVGDAYLGSRLVHARIRGKHGASDQEVREGDYIIQDENGIALRVMSKAAFEAAYDPLIRQQQGMTAR